MADVHRTIAIVAAMATEVSVRTPVCAGTAPDRQQAATSSPRSGPTTAGQYDRARARSARTQIHACIHVAVMCDNWHVARLMLCSVLYRVNLS